MEYSERKNKEKRRATTLQANDARLIRSQVHEFVQLEKFTPVFKKNLQDGEVRCYIE